MTVQTSWTNEKHNNAGLCLAQHCIVGQDRPETQYTTEESARFMSDPTRAVKCMLKRLCKHHSEASVHSWSFPYQGTAVRGQSGDRGILGRENWRDCRRRALGFSFRGYLLETYSSTQQIVALSTTESE